AGESRGNGGGPDPGFGLEREQRIPGRGPEELGGLFVAAGLEGPAGGGQKEVSPYPGRPVDLPVVQGSRRNRGEIAIPLLPVGQSQARLSNAIVAERL